MCGFSEAMMASSMILGGLKSYQQQQATAQRYDNQATFLRQKAAIEQERIRRLAKQQAARRRVSFATSGVQIAGSPTEVLARIAKDSAYEARLVGWNNGHRAGQLDADASSARRAGSNLLGQAGFDVAGKYGEDLWKAIKGP